MELLDKLVILGDSGQRRSFELWQGDLTDMPDEEAVDILVVSAFADNYWPVEGTLIGEMDKKGVSVQELAGQKMVDLRTTCSCWLSQPIEPKHSGINFKQILCFEPLQKGNPTELVGDIFRCLVPFVCGNPPHTSIAMPLVSSGNVGVAVEEMMDALFQAAVKWLEHGLPAERLKLVQLPGQRVWEMKGAFAILKRYYQASKILSKSPEYDVFISYSHENTDVMTFIKNELTRQAPNIRLFVDQMELEPGAAWQQKIYQSLDSARKVLALYSQPYFKSKNCQEEFNISWVIHRQKPGGLLFPIYLYSAPDMPGSSGIIASASEQMTWSTSSIGRATDS